MAASPQWKAQAAVLTPPNGPLQVYPRRRI